MKPTEKPTPTKKQFSYSLDLVLCMHADYYVHDMQDAGMALLVSFDALIYDNLFENVKYGIRLSLGSARNQVYSNTFDSCSGGEFGFWKLDFSDNPSTAA